MRTNKPEGSPIAQWPPATAARILANILHSSVDFLGNADCDSPDWLSREEAVRLADGRATHDELTYDYPVQKGVAACTSRRRTHSKQHYFSRCGFYGWTICATLKEIEERIQERDGAKAKR